MGRPVTEDNVAEGKGSTLAVGEAAGRRQRLHHRRYRSVSSNSGKRRDKVEELWMVRP